MNRFFVIIALVFAIASVSGATASFAHAGPARLVAAVADNLCLEQVQAAQLPGFKLCVKRLKGMAIPCPHQPLVQPVAEDIARPGEVPAPALRTSDQLPEAPGAERQFRPPRA